jgi:hypothetical protein
VHTARVILFVSFLAGCYQPPEIPRDMPLSCSSNDPAECPAGYVCIGNRICAPDSCQSDEDCPVGLACTRMGCLPPGADAGPGTDGVVRADAAAIDDAPAGPDGLVRVDAAAGPDTVVGADAPAGADAGGGS